jgi:cold-inducible RNA-binding protein
MEHKIYVANLAKSITPEELKALFAQAGQVTSVEVIRERAGVSKGFAFVEMSSQSEAQKAVSMFNGYTLDERQLAVTVNVARPREERPAGGSGFRRGVGFRKRDDQNDFGPHLGGDATTDAPPPLSGTSITGTPPPEGKKKKKGKK